MQDFLARYYELDQLKKKIDLELDKMKRVLLETFPEPVDQKFGVYQLKIYLQDRGSYDLGKIFPLLPNDELRLYAANPNNANIKELIKQGILSTETSTDAFTSKQTPIISVKEVR